MSSISLAQSAVKRIEPLLFFKICSTKTDIIELTLGSLPLSSTKTDLSLSPSNATPRSAPSLLTAFLSIFRFSPFGSGLVNPKKFPSGLS